MVVGLQFAKSPVEKYIFGCLFLKLRKINQDIF